MATVTQSLRSLTLAVMGASAALLAVGANAVAEPAKYDAVYSLPTDPAYADVAVYPLVVVRATRASAANGGALQSITYKLPDDLVGATGEEMTMVPVGAGDPDFVKLVCFRTNSVGFCAKGSEGQLSCSIRFRDFQFDGEQALSALRTKYDGDEKLGQREAALFAFARDAIGTLLITPAP